MIVTFALFFASFAILVFFYLAFFLRFALRSEQQPAEKAYWPPVTVIICARNEWHNLQRFLPLVLHQDYPFFEVIVVNDGSTDNTAGGLQSINHNRLRVISHQKRDDDFSGKRSALRAGLEAAAYEIILLTDADCLPASNRWIQCMVSALQEGQQIVLGYSPYLPEEGLLNRFIRYENFLTALYYLSFASAGFPYMGVGRNLLYRKSVLAEIKTPVTKRTLMSGDDDLTVNRLAHKQNVALMIHPDAHVFTLAPAAFSAFIHQKRRHYAAGYHYRMRHQAVLGTLYFSQVAFNVTFLILLLQGFMLIGAITIFLIKNFLQLLIFRKAMQKLNVHNLWLFTPVFDICASLFFVTLGSLSLFKVKTWK
ncbi:MAG: glycosyl transferase family 2 [Chitinophagales bacterium]|nr:MAG: glycosyl transferase family 2 [Chitinophagales bacterium]